MGAVRTTFKGGSRFYEDPEDRSITVPGVTSIIGMMSKPFLQAWAAKMTAELAVNSIDFIAKMAENDKQGAIDYLKGVSRRYTKERSEIGSMAHDAFERLALGDDPGPIHPNIDNHVKHFREFIAAVNPEFISLEQVAWNDTHQWAGSYDFIARIWLDESRKPTPDRSGTPVLVMGDFKTSKATYPDVALQMSAYSHAERIIDTDGVSHEVPKFDGGVVLWVTEDQWALKPVDIGDHVYDVFLALRKVFDWDRNLSKKVLGNPVAGSKSRRQTGTERRQR